MGTGLEEEKNKSQELASLDYPKGGGKGKTTQRKTVVGGSLKETTVEGKKKNWGKRGIRMIRAQKGGKRGGSSQTTKKTGIR